MCHLVHALTFDCECTVQREKYPIIIKLCEAATKHNDYVICVNAFMKPTQVEHHPIMCRGHMLAEFQAEMGFEVISAPKKTSFSCVKDWYYYADGRFDYDFTRAITKRRVEMFLTICLTEEEVERRWQQEFKRPMFGYEYHESERACERGWTNFVGVEEGSATLLPTKAEVEEDKAKMKRKWGQVMEEIKARKEAEDIMIQMGRVVKEMEEGDKQAKLKKTTVGGHKPKKTVGGHNLRSCVRRK